MPKKPAAKVVAAAALQVKEKKEEDCGSSGSGATTRAAAARKVLRALKRWQQKKHAQLISTLHNKDDVDPITLDAVRDIPRDSLFVLVTESGQKHGYDSQAWAQALAKDARHPSTRERLRPEAIHACVCAASTFAKRHPDQASPALVRAVRRLRTPVTLVHIEQRPPRRPRGRYLRAAARGIRRKLRWMLILRVSPLFVLKSVKVSGRISEPVIEYDIEDSRSTSGVGPLADRGAWRTRGRSRSRSQSQSVTPTARGGRQEGAASADSSAAASAAYAASAADASGEFAAFADFAASATSVASTITVGGLGSMARSAAGSLFNSSGRRVLYSVDDAAGGASAASAGAAAGGAAAAGAEAAARRGSASSSGPSRHSSGSYKPSILAKSVQDKGLVAFASDEGMARDASDLVEDILAGHTSLEDLNGELTDGETDDEDADAHSQAEASLEEAARVAAPAPAAAAESAVGGGEEGNGGGESDGDSWATATSGSDGDDDDDDDSDFVP
jgi:hypothetical protein